MRSAIWWQATFAKTWVAVDCAIWRARKLSCATSTDGSERATRTDHFGDFRFSGLIAPSSRIELRVRKDGMEKVLATRDRTGSVNLGTLLY